MASTPNLRLRFCLVAILAIATTAGPLFASAAATTPDQHSSRGDNAALHFWNREIVVLRGTIAGASPEQRADRASERLSELPLNARASDIQSVPFDVEGQAGIAFFFHGKILFFLGNSDLDKESGETLTAVSEQILVRLNEALEARAAERSWPVIRAGLLFTFIGLALLLVTAALIWHAQRLLVAALERRQPLVRAPLQLFGFDLRPPIDSLVVAAVRTLAAVLILSAVYSWTTLSLRRFPYTKPWGDQLGGYVLQLLGNLGSSALHSLPGLLAVVIIFLITRWIVRFGQAFFEQVSLGRLRVSWLDPDVAQATQRIFTGVAWMFATVVAYPYIPGSGTDAFKGISVFVGLVISLGSTGIINQVMSGLFVVYSRALKPGEWVQVNEIEGEVLEVGLLAGKIRTVEGQEVTVPNSVLVGTATKNHTRLGYPDGMIVSCTVTIGYDAPWRQVEGLLLLAADRAPNIRKRPAPYVLQRELSDFYVAYTLIARIDNARLRVETLSDLHAQIQDAFNEFGVQIMSPHFVIQPAGGVGVPRSKWHAPPARQTSSEFANK